MKPQVDCFPDLPISPQLRGFMSRHDDFRRSLKLFNQERFVPLNRFILSYPPGTTDQVIGMWYADKKTLPTGKEIFKQDFVVNVGGSGREFISYSRDRSVPPSVYPLAAFFERYGRGGKYYHRDHEKPWMHHYDDVSDLPEDERLRDEARRVFGRLLSP